jgi:hypothetical protein
MFDPCDYLDDLSGLDSRNRSPIGTGQPRITRTDGVVEHDQRGRSSPLLDV